jgi:hypothetical protein
MKIVAAESVRAGKGTCLCTVVWLCKLLFGRDADLQNGESYTCLMHMHHPHGLLGFMRRNPCRQRPRHVWVAQVALSLHPVSSVRPVDIVA